MKRRIFLLWLGLVILSSCQPVEFPKEAPTQVAPYSVKGSEPEAAEPPPPPPKGLESLSLTPEMRIRIGIVLGVAGVALVLALLGSRSGALSPVLAASLLPIVIALFFGALEFQSLTQRLAFLGRRAAEPAGGLWQANQPVLFGLFSALAIAVVSGAVAVSRRDPEASEEPKDGPSRIVFIVLMTLAIPITVLGLYAFTSMSRLMLALFDPELKVPITSIVSQAQTVLSRLVITIVSSLAGTLFVFSSLVVSLVGTRQRAKPAGRRVVVIALIVILAVLAAWQHRWVKTLSTTALTGRVPAARSSFP